MDEDKQQLIELSKNPERKANGRRALRWISTTSSWSALTAVGSVSRAAPPTAPRRAVRSTLAARPLGGRK